MMKLDHNEKITLNIEFDNRDEMLDFYEIVEEYLNNQTINGRNEIRQLAKNIKKYLNNKVSS